MRVLGQGGYGSVVALDRHRVCKLQGGDHREDGTGIACAALREVVALGAIPPARGRRRLGRVVVHPSGMVGIEIPRYRISLLDWLRRERSRSRSRRRSASATPARLAAIVRDVAQELAFAHARGYVHRDVKPENVMLDARGRAHLIDWGMSRQVGGGGDGDGCGRWTPAVTTLWYRAPELFTGDAYGPAVDMWSLGVMIVELAGGTCPFRGRTELEQAAHYVDVLGPPPPGVLPRWAFATAADAQEPCRAETVWAAAVPQLRSLPGIAHAVDALIRWTPAERMTAEQLLLHPALGPHPAAAAAAASPPPPPPPLPLPRLPFPTSRLRAALNQLLLPACTRLGLPVLPVGWCAARFLWRALAGGTRPEAKGSRATATATATAAAAAALVPLCLDLAAKLAGTRRARGLGLPGGARVAAAQVRLLASRLGGTDGLADGVEQAFAVAAVLRPRVPDECPAQLAPAAHAWSRLALELSLRARPEHVLRVRRWGGGSGGGPGLGDLLRALGAYVATGLPRHLATLRAAPTAIREARPARLTLLALRALAGLPDAAPCLNGHPVFRSARARLRFRTGLRALG